MSSTFCPSNYFFEWSIGIVPALIIFIEANYITDNVNKHWAMERSEANLKHLQSNFKVFLKHLKSYGMSCLWG